MFLLMSDRDTGDPVLSVCHGTIRMDHTGHFRNRGELIDAAQTRQPKREEVS